jgi:hypothetical protein
MPYRTLRESSRSLKAQGRRLWALFAKSIQFIRRPRRRKLGKIGHFGKSARLFLFFRASLIEPGGFFG